MFYSSLPLPSYLLCRYLLIHMLFLLVFSQLNQRRAGTCFDFVLPFFLYRKGEKRKTAPWKVAAISCFPSTETFVHLPESLQYVFLQGLYTPATLKTCSSSSIHCTGNMKYFIPAQESKSQKMSRRYQERTGELQPCLMCSTDSKPHWELFPTEPLQNSHKDTQLAFICFLDDSQITRT